MRWEDCLKEGIVREMTPDLDRSESTRDMAFLRESLWSTISDEKWTTLKVEAYYEIIKELVLSMMYKEGLNCKNHKCLILYLRQRMADFDFETEKIDELRELQHGISYRGISIDPKYLRMNEIKNIIRKLKERIS